MKFLEGSETEDRWAQRTASQRCQLGNDLQNGGRLDCPMPREMHESPEVRGCDEPSGGAALASEAAIFAVVSVPTAAAQENGW